MLASLYDPQSVIIAGAIAGGVEELLEVAGHRLPSELDLSERSSWPQRSAPTSSPSLRAVAAAVEAARDGALHVK